MSQRLDGSGSLHRSRHERPLSGGCKGIALVLSGLGAGGTERVACSLANHWASDGRKIHVIALDRENDPSYYDYHTDVELVRLGLPPQRRPAAQAALAIARRALAIRNAIRNAAPDVVLSFLTRQNILTLAATRGMSVPVVVSERSNPERQHPGPLWHWLRNRLYPRAARLVVMTNGARDFFSPAIAARTSIIPNPVVLPSGWRARRGNNRLVAVGRLETVKRFDRLLRAFHAVAARHPAWTLTIWGEGPERAALEQLTRRLGLDGRVELPGVTEMPGGWIETADAFVLTSDYEGWPNVLAEAMASGLPVIAVDCPHGPSDMIRHRHDGFLVSPDEPADLTAAIDELLGDPLLRDRLGTASAASAARFAPAPIMDLWEEIVADVCGRTMPKAPSPVSVGDRRAGRAGRELPQPQGGPAG
ncbi:glycosyltransferase family 4 protein [Allosphingosinicella deserti]|uniref:glycosyltransferase family 4 protein n=1 Tax=Allosphingosinicella deserti TaxID=2116704 RepID=UPI001304F460|nr:glycosyltransferase family 4 protein [Sphingomonas deserti]